MRYGGRKNGHLRGRQRYRCVVCFHQWVERRGKRVDLKGYYLEWLFGRRTLVQIASQLDCSVPTLRKRFDGLDFPEGLLCPPPNHGINLLIDCVFFGRAYGYLCFHDTQQIIYCHEIKTETVADLSRGLCVIRDAGYRIKSVTIDGRRGFYGTIKRILGPVPVQMCLFHQKAITRRYLTDRPSLQAGKDLKELMNRLLEETPENFVAAFYALKRDHQTTLNRRNEKREFAHQKLRAAYRSVENNLPMLFTWREFPQLQIPNTTGRLEGFFSHLKERIQMHRGLKKHRKKKAIRCFLNHQK